MLQFYEKAHVEGTFRRGWPRLFKDTAFALHCFLQMNTDLKSQITVPLKNNEENYLSVLFLVV